jgi:DNA-binding PucR family transcriptional regulator
MSLAQQHTFRQGADRVALNLLRERAAAEAAGAASSRRWLEVLEGGPGAAAAAAEAKLDRPLLVWACEPRNPSGSTNGATQPHPGLSQVIDALRFDPACSHPDAGVVAVSGTVYVLQPVASTRHPELEACTAARSFLSRRGGQLCDRIAISRVAHRAIDVPGSRRDADRALRVLQAEHPVGAVGHIEELATAALLIELRDLAVANGHQPSSAVQKLLDYDRRKGTDLVPTLRSWLTRLGDISPAAADMNIHPNTFRYRLRRAFEIGGIDPEAAPHTLSLMLELKLVELQQM